MGGYPDRKAAGERLSSELRNVVNYHDAIVLALPRGGVPVGFEVAQALNLPLDVIVARKLGSPNNPEFAFGAISEGGAIFLNPGTVAALGLNQQQIDETVAREQTELKRRAVLYRSGRALPDLSGKTVIVVDDGIATGATLKAALIALGKMGPGRVIVAVPVAPADAPAEFASLCDDFVCPLITNQLNSVGGWYQRFDQVQDAQVIELLENSRKAMGL